MQVTPGFDAKGIETVRRDTCPAVAKTMERSLRLLFATRDLSEVRSNTCNSLLPTQKPACVYTPACKCNMLI